MAFNADTFKEKAGPLPIWAWTIIGGAVVYYVYKKKQTGVTNTTDTTTTDPNANVDYGGAMITADYDLANQLGILNSNVGTANTAITGNTTATNANTVAVGNNTAAETSEKAKIPTGYYKDNPTGQVYKLDNGLRWRVSQTTLKKLQKQKTVFHPITDKTIQTIPLKGIV